MVYGLLAGRNRQQVSAMTAFGAMLRSIRADRKMSGEELAERIGKTQGTVSKWERGVNTPRRDTILDIARELDTPLEPMLKAAGFASPDIDPLTEEVQEVLAAMTPPQKRTLIDFARSMISGQPAKHTPASPPTTRSKPRFGGAG